MSAVTLETMKADFDAARAELRDQFSAAITGRHAVRGDYIVEPNPDVVVSEWRELGRDSGIDRSRMIFAANVFVVARDYGLQAAMLYKLSDGAIDPRGAA